MKTEFDEFWSAKPRRKGSNPKEQARIKFLRAVASGAGPKLIVAAAHEWTREETENGKIGSEFVPMAATWLNQKRYNDYEGITPADMKKWDTIAEKHGYIWDDENKTYVRTQKETA